MNLLTFCFDGISKGFGGMPPYQSGENSEAVLAISINIIFTLPDIDYMQ